MKLASTDAKEVNGRETSVLADLGNTDQNSQLGHYTALAMKTMYLSFNQSNDNNCIEVFCYRFNAIATPSLTGVKPCQDNPRDFAPPNTRFQLATAPIIP